MLLIDIPGTPCALFLRYTSCASEARRKLCSHSNFSYILIDRVSVSFLTDFALQRSVISAFSIYICLKRTSAVSIGLKYTGFMKETGSIL